MIALIREHLLLNNELINLLYDKEAIYYVEKPEQVKVDDYIVMRDKLISDKYISNYQIEFRIYSKNINKTNEIAEELISYLNDPRGQKIIKNENTVIRNITVLNGGGIARDDEDNFVKVVFFLLKR